MKHLRIFAALFCLFFTFQTVYAAPGDLDAAFGTGGIVTTGFGDLSFRGRAVLVQPDGKIVVAGQTYSNSTYDFAVARYDTDGRVDSSFGGSGAVITPIGISSDYVTGAALQADGKIVVVGTVWTGLEQFGVARYNTDGSLDTTFGGTGKIITDMIDNVGYDSPAAVRVQADGKILVVGTCSNKICLARYNANGALDNSFDADGKLILATVNPQEQETARALTIQNDGKILVAGDIRRTNGEYDFLIVRFNQNGTLDASFGSGGRAMTPVSVYLDYATAIAVQPDGKIVAAGNSYRVGAPLTRPNVYTDYDAAVVRYLPDGTPDATFDADGKNTVRFGDDKDLFDDFITAVSVQQNGKVLIAGYSWDGARNNLTLARFETGGALDTSFGNGGKVVTTIGVFEDKAYSTALQKDGKIIVGGESHLGDRLSFTVVRYLGDPVATVYQHPFDFDGDGRADLSVFRPLVGMWYVQNVSPNGYAAQQFGQSGDVPAPADYDRDGRTDYAVFRPSEGRWHILFSASSQTGFVQFGQAGDVPVPADYDGDGKADVAVYRPSNGYWYRLNSSNGAFVAAQFGAPEDKPVPADYDGDGRADIAVYRPSTGYWYRTNSANGAFAFTQFGAAEDKPVVGDYDGDGKADIAVFRPSNGYWYRLNSGSNNSFGFAQFGQNGDFPAPADYDGDGRTDLAVFRPAANTWYLQRTAAGFTAVQFGQNGDLPVPSAFVR